MKARLETEEEIAKFERLQTGIEDTRPKEPRLAVVIPAYNEAKTIADVIKGAAKYADEVIVVDDGSTDNTAFIARAAGATVIRHPNNRGYGAALAIGLNTAALNGNDLIVYLDGDGQHDPNDIPKIIAPILRKEADLVIGSRFLMKQSKEKIPKYRTIGQHALTKATNIGNRTKITDSQSGFRCITKKAALMLDMKEDGMGFSSEMILEADRLGLTISEVPITVKYEGLETSSMKPVNHGIQVLTSIIRAIRDDHPLLYFGVGGLIVTIIGIFAGMYSIYQFISVRALPFIPSIAAVLLFFLGLISIFTGIILNSLAQNRFEHK